MQHVPELGKIIAKDSGEVRDAIHIAVIPMMSSEILEPGQHVGLDQFNNKYADSTTRKVGIVDPFLNVNVMPGQTFWLCMYPQTITSLNHNWQHPAFEPQKVSDAEAASILWIRKYAITIDFTYDGILEAAKDYLENGEYIVEGGKWEGYNMPQEFWDHYSVVVGKVIPKDNRGSFFSCSC